jgi:Zn finger protein HypA/HybF involved in hydrogenase expression
MEATLKKMVNWDVIMLRKEGKVKCSCGYEGVPKIVEKQHGHTVFVCPECGSVPDVLEGGDIILKEVVVD